MIPQEQKQIVRRGYDKLSFEYRADDTPDDYQDYAAWVHILADRLPEGSPVLDIGCGCGLPATKVLAERFDVTGVDFSEIQISRAKRLVPAAHFVCGDISEQSFPPGSYAAVVSFYAIIHMPLAEHPALFNKIASWLRPSGYFLATVGHDEWTGVDETYLGVHGGKMCWSHADENTNVRWIQEADLEVHSTRFVPEGKSGHTLVLAQKPPVKSRSQTLESQPTERTVALAELGRSYIGTCLPDNFVCATAGGSVGRGSADNFSDLDLNVYLCKCPADSSQNVSFEGEVIQVHTHQLPQLRQVRDNPWESRFLTEERVVTDPNGDFRRLNTAVLRYLRSEEGHQHILRCAANVVEKRKLWYEESVLAGKMTEAGMAAMAAWTDAAFTLAYAETGAVGTGNPIGAVKALALREQIVANWPLDPTAVDSTIDRRVEGTNAYRAYLQDVIGLAGFAFEPVQDQLLGQKVSRYRGLGDPLLVHQAIYEQAYWLLLSCGTPIENHIADLPIEHRDLLTDIGFRSIELAQARELLNAADSLLALSGTVVRR